MADVHIARLRRLTAALILPVLAVLAGSAPGQQTVRPEATPVPGARPAPIFAMELDGPDALRRAFLPTDFATMVATEDARRVWPEAWDMFNRAWVRGETPESFWSWDGRIRVLAWVDTQDDQRERGLIFLQGGAGDLQGIRAEAEHLMVGGAGAEPVERQLAGRTFRTVHADTPGTITLPQIIDDRLVSFFGREEDMDWVVREGLLDLAALPAEAPGRRPLSLRLDLAQLSALIDRESRTDAQMAEVFGLGSLRELRAVLRPAGPRVMLEVEVAFGEGDRGLLGALLPDHREPPTLTALVPDDARPFMVGPLRLGELTRAVMRLFAYGFGSAAADPVAEMRAEIAAELGFDLFTGLLDHFDGEVMVLHAPSAPVMAMTALTTPLMGSLLGFRIREHEAVAGNLARLLDAMEVDPEPQTSEHRGVAIHERQMMPGASLHWAVTEELLLLGFGDPGLELLRAVLDRAAAGAQDLPRAIARTRAQAPPGLNGIAIADLAGSLPGTFPYLGLWLGYGLLAPLHAADPTAQGVQPLDALRALLTKYGMQDLVAYTGFADDTWRLRLLW